ncbi:hypothetical protein ATE48_15925 [Candidatus Viadribacter manganicus]|uniref:Uncharacterized protein n=1 Tax=Candidatus Viadribacter manganicus TaxID=1759059 RepID=A0A1B1AL66_9PROT|nr:hypothetical protein ATE48_15925 [Candidatus Viadribacter manganicus]
MNHAAASLLYQMAAVQSAWTSVTFFEHMWVGANFCAAQLASVAARMKPTQARRGGILQSEHVIFVVAARALRTQKRARAALQPSF